MLSEEEVSGLIERSKNNEASIKTLTSQWGHFDKQLVENTKITTEVLEILTFTKTGLKVLMWLAKAATLCSGAWFAITHWGQSSK